MPQCTAHRRDGERCTQQAMHGRTVCRMHGGKAGRPPIHGRYAKSLDRYPELRRAYDEACGDPQLMEIQSEVALLRANLQQYLDKYAGVAHPKTMQIIADYGEAITRLVERRHKMLHGERVTITMRDLETYAARLMEIVRQVYGDDERYAKCVELLSRFYPGAGAGQGAS